MRRKADSGVVSGDGNICGDFGDNDSGEDYRMGREADPEVVFGNRDICGDFCGNDSGDGDDDNDTLEEFLALFNDGDSGRGDVGGGGGNTNERTSGGGGGGGGNSGGDSGGDDDDSNNDSGGNKRMRREADSGVVSGDGDICGDFGDNDSGEDGSTGLDFCARNSCSGLGDEAAAMASALFGSDGGRTTHAPTPRGTRSTAGKQRQKQLRARRRRAALERRTLGTEYAAMDDATGPTGTSL
jgi:hypothetical protein